MTTPKAAAPEPATPSAEIDPGNPAPDLDIGRPVEWMVDPDRRDIVLGVTYAFSRTGIRRTVWYTPNKRRAKAFAIMSAAGAS